MEYDISFASFCQAMEVNAFTLKLDKKIALTHDVLELHFSKPNELSFKAGQFLQFQVPDAEKMLLRSYSIASTPTDTTLEFCIKILPGGKASTLFANAIEGDEFQVRGPRGLFVNTEDAPLYCIATGAGIAPVMGIIQDELKNKKNNNEIKLLFGVRDEQDMFWQHRFAELKQNFPNFDYSLTLSQPKLDGNWNGLRGRVTDHIPTNLLTHRFFLCGSPQMVKDVRDLLIKNGVEAKQIHFEVF